MRYYSEDTVKGLLEQLDSHFVKYLESLPSIEVNETHGRCIDADAFKKRITKALKYFKGHPNFVLAKKVTEDFCLDIDEEPTVLEATEWRKEEGKPSHKPKNILGEKEQAWVDELKAGIEYLEGEMKDIAEDFTRIPKEDFEARKKNMSEFFKREKARDEKREIIKMLEEGRLRLG